MSEEWLARMRELARRDADELTPRPQFTVYGLAEPEVLPLGATLPMQDRDGEWASVGLTYGDWASAAGPWLIVVSTPPRATPFDKEFLLGEIDTDRNRLAAEAWVDDEEPPGPPEYRPGRIKTDKRNEHALLCRHGTLAAAHLRPGDANVTVLVRGVDLAGIRLVPVADLEPYLRGREVQLEQIEEYGQRMEPVLEPAEGLAAYRAYARHQVDGLLRIWAVRQSGAVPRFRAGEDATTAALGIRACHELSDRSGISLIKAETQIKEFTDHLAAMVQYVRWFTGNERLRDRAVDETLRHALLGEKVSSDKAQQAWANYWNYQTSLAVQSASHEALKAAARVGSELIREKWIDAWLEWSFPH
jgi:hypothetical protein